MVAAYLADRNAAVGETVQLGWLIFRIAEVGPPAVIESLDFKNIASFTRDLRAAESIYRTQQEKLNMHGAKEVPCSLRHLAIVSKSYESGHPQAFIKRDGAVEGHSSGWYVGISDDPLDMSEANSFMVKSLYEISIADRRTIPYWLMPINTIVHLGSGSLDGT